MIDVALVTTASLREVPELRKGHGSRKEDPIEKDRNCTHRLARNKVDGYTRIELTFYGSSTTIYAKDINKARHLLKTWSKLGAFMFLPCICQDGKAPKYKLYAQPSRDESCCDLTSPYLCRNSALVSCFYVLNASNQKCLLHCSLSN